MVWTVASLSDYAASGAGVRAAPAAACVLSASDIQYFAARGPELQVGAILLTPEGRPGRVATAQREARSQLRGFTYS